MTENEYKKAIEKVTKLAIISRIVKLCYPKEFKKHHGILKSMLDNKFYKRIPQSKTRYYWDMTEFKKCSIKELEQVLENVENYYINGVDK